ncbi:MAG: tetratricopeptide repeat protein, partial [Bacteroidota bacterium]
VASGLPDGVTKVRLNTSEVVTPSKGASSLVQAVLPSSKQAVAINPEFTEARMELAELYFLVKEHKKANDQFNIILAKDNKNSEALFLKGMNYKDMGDTASAVQAFQKTYELDANNYDAVMQLGILYAAAKNKSALDYYIAASRLNPKSAEPPYNAGVFLQQKGEYKKAVKMYQQALKADDGYYLAYYNAGIINVDIKQYSDAIENFDAVVRINGNYADAYYMRGYAYEKLKKPEDAKINYEYALEINPGYTFAKEALARLR